MFYNIKLDLTLIICFLMIPIFSILYSIIYRKYNKRNELSIQEIVKNLLKYVSYSFASTFILILGIDYYLEGMYLIEAIYERYAYYTLGVIIISFDIFYYYRFIKKSLIDLVKSEVIKEEENTRIFAEHVILIFLGLFIIMPLINLPTFARLLGDKEELVNKLVESFGYMVIGIFLLYTMNPLEIIHKNEEIKDINNSEIENKEIKEKENKKDNKIKTKIETKTKNKSNSKAKTKSKTKSKKSNTKKKSKK